MKRCGLRILAVRHFLQCVLVSACMCGPLFAIKTKSHSSLRQLNQTIEKQRQTILDLKEEIARLKNGVTPEEWEESSAEGVKSGRVNPQPAPKEHTPPVQKLLPEEDHGLLDKKEFNQILGMEEESVADSSQEMMHYYYEGRKNLEAGKYEEAIKNFKKFVDENPAHVYADRAQFLVLESYFRAQEYGLAVLAANTLETHYPYSFRLQEALYKKGLAFASMRQVDHAGITFEGLIRRYPQHPFSQRAGKELAGLAKDEIKTKSRNHATAPPLLDDAQ